MVAVLRPGRAPPPHKRVQSWGKHDQSVHRVAQKSWTTSSVQWSIVRGYAAIVLVVHATLMRHPTASSAAVLEPSNAKHPNQEARRRRKLDTSPPHEGEDRLEKGRPFPRPSTWQSGVKQKQMVVQLLS